MIPAEYFTMSMGGALVALIWPVLCVLAWRKYELNVVPAFFGTTAFLLTVLVLEPMLLNAAVRSNIATGAAYVLIAAIAAGVLEELPKWLSYRILRQNFQGVGVGISLGLGFGGGASVALCLQLIGQLQDFNTVNSGTLTLAETEAFIANLLRTEPVYFLLGSVDRLPEIFLQTALAMIVWYAVAHDRPIWLAAAVLLHIAAELPAAVMRVRGVDNLLLAEIVVFGTALALLALAWRLCRRDLGVAGKRPLPAWEPGILTAGKGDE
ncbi:MAG: YhfC family intramembrane metalloprotease [Gracilibacteraceae bacterium]|nr:YhfC family intramembrane metalloprotease [Gracilibacteraceae bacterium]